MAYVKELSYDWPELRLLADFMEVGTDPIRWRNYHENDGKNQYTYPDDGSKRGKSRSPRVTG